MIFVDTGFLFAFFSANPDHSRGREVFESFKDRRLPELPLTNDHVVFEAITLTRMRSTPEAALAWSAALSWPGMIASGR